MFIRIMFVYSFIALFWIFTFFLYIDFPLVYTSTNPLEFLQYTPSDLLNQTQKDNPYEILVDFVEL